MIDESRNPWTILSSSEKYQNPWIQVVEYQVIHPSGKPGIYGKVHYRNYAVGIVPYENGKIWMVGQYRFPLEQYSWEIPEGGSPEGEDPLETAKRELKEETGMEAHSYEPLFEIHLSNSVTDEWGVVYLARDLIKGEAEPEESEELVVKAMDLEEVYELVEAKKITDSLTVAAVYKMMLMKSTGKLEI